MITSVLMIWNLMVLFNSWCHAPFQTSIVAMTNFVISISTNFVLRISTRVLDDCSNTNKLRLHSWRTIWAFHTRDGIIVAYHLFPFFTCEFSKNNIIFMPLKNKHHTSKFINLHTLPNFFKTTNSNLTNPFKWKYNFEKLRTPMLQYISSVLTNLFKY